jgi:hypothetical protein
VRATDRSFSDFVVAEKRDSDLAAVAMVGHHAVQGALMIWDRPRHNPYRLRRLITWGAFLLLLAIGLVVIHLLSD